MWDRFSQEPRPPTGQGKGRPGIVPSAGQGFDDKASRPEIRVLFSRHKWEKVQKHSETGRYYVNLTNKKQLFSIAKHFL